jgi:hypothetical protein
MTDLTYSLAPMYSEGRPPTRIFLQDLEYRLVGPRFVKPPLLDTVKLILNWTGPGAVTAKNIMYALLVPSIDTTNPANLLIIANNMMSAAASSNLTQNIAAPWVLSSVTAKDNGLESGAFSTSTHAAVTGGAAAPAVPPQSAVVISWGINASYRGGKPRTYLPGLASSYTTPSGGAGITTAAASAIEGYATAFMNAFNESLISSTNPALGTISYQTGHVPRPTPIFREFFSATVHERLDSQRRRSGKESAYGEIT